MALLVKVLAKPGQEVNPWNTWWTDRIDFHSSPLAATQMLWHRQSPLYIHTIQISWKLNLITFNTYSRFQTKKPQEMRNWNSLTFHLLGDIQGGYHCYYHLSGPQVHSASTGPCNSWFHDLKSSCCLGCPRLVRHRPPRVLLWTECSLYILSCPHEGSSAQCRQVLSAKDEVTTWYWRAYMQVHLCILHTPPAT